MIALPYYCHTALTAVRHKKNGQPCLHCCNRGLDFDFLSQIGHHLLNNIGTLYIRHGWQMTDCHKWVSISLPYSSPFLHQPYVGHNGWLVMVLLLPQHPILHLNPVMGGFKFGLSWIRSGGLLSNTGTLCMSYWITDYRDSWECYHTITTPCTKPQTTLGYSETVGGLISAASRHSKPIRGASNLAWVGSEISELQRAQV